MDILVANVLGDVALVLVASQILGAMARWIGQPTVVGQILAGILLGPSLLGRLPGHLTSRVFPHSVMPSLTVLSQVAVVIFMFGVGYELDYRSLRGMRRAAPLVAAGALVVPMGLGFALVPALRSEFVDLGLRRITPSLVLFMGVAVSITALPVLAAIVRERGIAGSTVGVTATAAAGLMDVPAWIVLTAALVGTAQKPSRQWPVTLLLICCFTVVMLVAVRPALRWWISRPRFVLSSPLPVALALALASAWVTASLGLHPVFGGFLAGLTMPTMDGAPDNDVLRPIEEIGGLLLPLFFVVTGLSVNIGAMDGIALAVLAVICVIASFGKLVPAYLASRASGLTPRDSSTVAVLVNTRGLTELIALNVGLNAHIIDQRLFTVLVLMALITTVATVPMLSLIRASAPPPSADEGRSIMPPSSASDS
jgi:Kef-type K+ transport system membrane component KefB